MKEFTFTVTVKVSDCMTKTEAKREIRTLINDQARWSDTKFVNGGLNGDWIETKIKCVNVQP